jgi:hypothetical protein
MTPEEIKKQSIQAYKQWSKDWAENAKIHSKYEMKPFENFRNTGIGKAVLLVANGYSFEENLETIKKYKDNVDIVCCDKTLGHLLDNGITPKICIVCDAHVSYDKYLKPWADKLDGTILFNNVCGNTEWSANGNWKDKYFYVNKDIMSYEKEFMAISGCTNTVTAGTNVSNMMVVLLTQSDNDRKQNLFYYDKMILIGFDYSWKFGGKYYAFDQDGGGKYYYMRHIYGLSLQSNIIFASNNLNTSASWLNLYIKAYKLPVVQCGKDALQSFGRTGDLEKQMQYRHKPSDGQKVNNILKNKSKLELELKSINNELLQIGTDHWLADLSI